MQEEHIKFYAQSVSREVKMLRFGWSGRPMIIFPTTLGRYYEAKDMGLIGSISHLIDAGKVVVYCPDTLNHESWYNKGIHPADKVRTHIAFDRMMRHEIVPSLQHRHHNERMIVAGAASAGYTAANFAFKHPEVVSDLICMSGSFDVSSFLGGYHDENVYFNNPIEYLPGLHHPDLWQHGDRPRGPPSGTSVERRPSGCHGSLAEPLHQSLARHAGLGRARLAVVEGYVPGVPRPDPLVAGAAGESFSCRPAILF